MGPKASVKSAGPKASVEWVGPKASVEWVGPKASVEWALIKVEAAHQVAKSEISWADVTATEIKLDAYPLNRYLDKHKLR